MNIGKPKDATKSALRDKEQCKQLWIEVFGDEEEFVDEFIAKHYTRENMHHLIDASGDIVAMLHVVPFSSDMGRVAYVYGVATNPKYRGRGYAKAIMRYTIKWITRKGYDAALLIPSEEWLKGFYAQFGFEQGARVEFKSNGDFDFGSGNPDNDILMVYSISSKAELYIKHKSRDIVTLHKI